MKFSVNINGTIRIVSELEMQSQLLNNYRNMVQTVKNNCPCSGNVRTMLIKSLNDILTEMENERSLYGTIGRVLEQNVSCYRTYEENMAKCEKTSVSWGNNVKSYGEADADSNSDKISYWTWADFWKLIGNAGMIGGTVSAIGNVITGGTDAKNILKSLKFVNSVVGGGAKAVQSGTLTQWQTWVGLQKGINFDKLSSTSFSNVFKESWNKQFIDDLGFNFDGTQTTADKVKVGTKWAGHIISLATNALDNYEEFQWQGVEVAVRGTTETVIETAVDIGISAAATAAVSAGLVALGFVGAPALVVGAGAALVTWAANGICKWVTGGKDIGEVAADFVCDVGEGAINLAKQGLEKAKEVGENIGEGIKKAGENIKNGVSSAWNSICSVFG